MLGCTKISCYYCFPLLSSDENDNGQKALSGISVCTPYWAWTPKCGNSTQKSHSDHAVKRHVPGVSFFHR